MKKSALVISLDIGIILFLLIIQAVIANGLSTGGVLLEKLEGQIRSYQKENAILNEKVSMGSSLSQVSEKAAKLDFVETKTAFVLTKSQPLAVRR